MPPIGDTSGIKFASGTNTSDGDWSSPLVAAVTGKKLRVMTLSITVLTTAGVVQLKTGSTVIFQAHLALGTPLTIAGGGFPICETTSGVALTPNNGTGVDSFINISYYEVEP
jgi:hypothetical protein